jgi:hypothetical protein
MSLVLASWQALRGLASQMQSPGHHLHAGHLLREHSSKTDVRIIDFVDAGHPALPRMRDQRGYRSKGYRIEAGTIRLMQIQVDLNLIER